MVLGRNGLRDERRRRALIDETLHGNGQDASEAASQDASARSRARAYSEAARVDHHAPISVCIPKRSLSLWGLFLAGAALIAGIEALYARIFLQVTPELQASLAAFDVMARGSLASWFASVVLCCSAMASLLVYLIRRHRTDDYRGRYRWWLWLVPLLLIVSVNAGTGLHQALGGALTSLSGAEIAVGGKGWWLMAYGVVFLPVVGQLAIELWPSRLATAFFCATIAAYSVGAAFELQAVHCATPLATTLTHSSVLLAAHFGALLTVLAYGRYVYLEAHDSLPERRKWRLKLPRPRRKKRSPKSAGDKPAQTGAPESAAPEKVAPEKTADKGGPLKRVRVDGSHSKFGQEASTPPKVTLSTSLTASDEDSEQRLSKADRKRLRREGARQ